MPLCCSEPLVSMPPLVSFGRSHRFPPNKSMRPKRLLLLLLLLFCDFLVVAVLHGFDEGEDEFKFKSIVPRRG